MPTGADDLTIATFANGLKNGIQKRPVMSSLWILGLCVAALGNGFSVTQDQLNNYHESLEHAQHVTDKELNQ